MEDVQKPTFPENEVPDYSPVFGRLPARLTTKMLQRLGFTARDGSALPPTLHVHASRHAAYHRMRVSQGYLPLEPSRGSTHNFWTRAGKGTSARRGA